MYSKILVFFLLISPIPLLASGESFDGGTNPLVYDCGTSDGIEMYDVTADDYLVGFDDVTANAGTNCGEELILIEGNEYDGQILDNGVATLAIYIASAVAYTPPASTSTEVFNFIPLPIVENLASTSCVTTSSGTQCQYFYTSATSAPTELEVLEFTYYKFMIVAVATSSILIMLFLVSGLYHRNYA